MSTISSAGHRIGQEAARVAMKETLSRISETGESMGSASISAGAATPAVSIRTQARDMCTSILESKPAVGLVVFLLTFILMCALNPPMAQKQTHPHAPPDRSVKKIMIWSTIAAGFAVLLPMGSR